MPELLAEGGHQVGGVFWVAGPNEMVIVSGWVFLSSSHFKEELCRAGEVAAQAVVKDGFCCCADEKSIRSD